MAINLKKGFLGNEYPGALITFEGTEGGGKSTQISLLYAELKSMGYSVMQLREPGGTPIGEEIRHTLKNSHNGRRMDIKTELLLMNSSRAQLVEEVIRPALKSGEIVLCDRFYDSTTAYQGYGRGIDLDKIKQIIDFAVGDVHPDLTLLLDVPVNVSEERRLIRQAGNPFVKDRFDEEAREFFERVEKGFRRIAEVEPFRVKVIDACKSVDEVYSDVKREVFGYLGLDLNA